MAARQRAFVFPAEPASNFPPEEILRGSRNLVGYDHWVTENEPNYSPTPIVLTAAGAQAITVDALPSAARHAVPSDYNINGSWTIEADFFIEGPLTSSVIFECHLSSPAGYNISLQIAVDNPTFNDYVVTMLYGTSLISFTGTDFDFTIPHVLKVVRTHNDTITLSLDGVDLGNDTLGIANQPVEFFHFNMTDFNDPPMLSVTRLAFTIP
jgi:hypothetical protein